MTIIYYKDSGEIASVKINPSSKNLQKGEQIVFSYSIKRGWINKHLYKLFFVSNYRVAEWNEENQAMDGLVLLQDLEDVLIWNQRRIHSGSYAGGYSSLFNGVGASVGHYQGQSIAVGDVVFMIGGKVALSWTGTTNPSSLRSLVLTIKKEIYPKRELEKFLSGIRNDGFPDISKCTCGNENQNGSSFCSMCGRILK